MKPRFHLTAMAACLILCAYVASAQAAQGAAAPSATPQVNQFAVSVHDLQSYIRQHAPFILLDVRDAAEYDKGHIPGAILMPLADILDGYARYPKEEMIVAYCKTGPRSEQAASYLRAHGYQRVYVLTGGYTAWTAAQ
ncbi:MAG: rhodanese-like domain-containing protein [Rhizomicrobium sp.]